MPLTLAWRKGRACPALPPRCGYPLGHHARMQHVRTRHIAHLTKPKISHLSNGETIRLADAVVRQFCYTVKCAPARRVGRVLWLGPQ